MSRRLSPHKSPNRAVSELKRSVQEDVFQNEIGCCEACYGDKALRDTHWFGQQAVDCARDDEVSQLNEGGEGHRKHAAHEVPKYNELRCRKSVMGMLKGKDAWQESNSPHTWCWPPERDRVKEYMLYT
mmetsp:Transcript_8427/g.21723  ORF Transcript_8427/g.21723 Transcript_8427/m.21723 type:complete len:128 (-) Transcript_8427:1145-1528(-)